MISAIADYLAYADAVGYSPKSVDRFRSTLTAFGAAARKSGASELQQISIEVVRAYHETIRQRGLAASTRRNILSTIRGFLRWAHDAGRLQQDISGRIELPKPEKRLPPKPLNREDVAQLFRLFRAGPSVSGRNRAMFEVLYACGLRRSELLGLDVGDIDFSRSTVFVRSGKGNKDRVVPMYRRAARAIRSYLNSRGSVLPRSVPLFTAWPADGNPGKRISPASLAAIFRQANRDFHKHLYPHLLRHTLAVHLLLGGADLRHVQAILGHESPDTTGRYLGLAKKDLKRGYDRATDIILGRKRRKRRATA